MDLYMWQGFRHRWEAFPHRVGALASGVVDGGSGRRIAGVYPGINGDTARLDHHVVRLEGLPAEIGAHQHTVELGFWDEQVGAGPFRAEGGAEQVLPIDLAAGQQAVALLQGVEWYPCEAPGADAATREGRVDRARPVWPTRLEVSIALRDGLVGRAAITHEDCADPLKRPQSGRIWHRVRLHALILQAPADLLGVVPLVLVDEGHTGHRRRLAGARHVAERAIPGLTGLAMRLGTRSGRRQGRYLSEVTARVLGQGDHVRAAGGWRGGGLPAPAWRESRLEGVLLHLPAQVQAHAGHHADPFRFVLPAGSAGRSPREPHVRVTGPEDRAIVEADWGMPIRGGG